MREFSDKGWNVKGLNKLLYKLAYSLGRLAYPLLIAAYLDRK